MKRYASIWALNTLFLLFCFSQIASAEPFETIINNGAPENRVDIAILGDGYTAAEMQKYRNDVQAFIEIFFDQEPFKDYRYFFNVHRIDVISNQSGADHPERNPAVTVDTALNATYNCTGIQRLICINRSTATSIAAKTLTPSQRDITLVVVNDSEYGGSGGSISVASTHPDVVEIVLHELGHSFGLLTDEYGGPPPPNCVNTVEPAAANATKATERSLIKWNHWIEPSTAIPTTSTIQSVPGAYQGAAYCDAGLYRPTFDSKMRRLGRPFEQINTEQLIKRIYNVVSPIDFSQPAATDITITRGDLQVFNVSPLTTVSKMITVAWYLDGQLQSTEPEFTVNSGNLNSGLHVVEVVVKDNTQKVRRDVENLLNESRKWNLTVNDTTAQTFTISGRVADEGGRGIGGVLMTLVSDGSEFTTATDENGNYSMSNLLLGADLTITPSKLNFSFNPLSASFTDLSSNQTANFTATAIPLLLTEENTPRAIALDAITWLRDPFSLFTSLNFSSDRRTRIMLFAANIELMPGKTIPVVTAQAEDSQQRYFPLTVEYVGKVPDLNWLTQVNVRLPDGLSGDVWVRISTRGVSSNKVLISIRGSE